MAADSKQMEMDALLRSKNLAPDIDDQVLNQIGMQVDRDFKIDKQSRSDWEERNKEALKLAIQVVEAKNFPWPNAANIKYPLLATACVQFSSRALPNIVTATGIVKGKVIGKDETGEKLKRATRIGQHMTYQLTDEMEEWTEEMDVLLVVLPISGCAFKKSYFSPLLGTNVSELVLPQNFVVNYKTKSLKRAPRVTHILELYPNEVTERIRSGLFSEIELGTSTGQDPEEVPPDPNDPEAAHIFLEQHRNWDLDGDGYHEPYIITIHKATSKVVRVVARFDADAVIRNDKNQIVRIKAVDYFTRFLFMPSPDAGFYGMGWGSLLGPINKTVDTTINQLLDAGTKQNMGGGFVGKGAKLPGGVIKRKLGEWKMVNVMGDDLKKNLVPDPTKEPSRVLFQLLGLMIDAGKELASVADVLTGEQPGSNIPATTTLALIEQGLKVFSAIYLRIHRSLKSEFKKLYRLNRLFLEDEAYFMAMDEAQAIARADYEGKSLDVQPVSDPKEVSDMQRIIKAQAMMELLGKGLNDMVIMRRYVDAMQIPEADDIFPDPNTPPPPDPKVVLESEKQELERAKFEFDMMKFRIELAERTTKAILNIAKAEAAEEGPQIEIYKVELAALQAESTAAAQRSEGGKVSGQKSVVSGQKKK